MKTNLQQDAIILERVFNNTVDKVYLAFSDAKSIEKWLSPAADILMRVETFDFTPGGKYRYAYTLPGGDLAKLTGRFLKINPPFLLSFTWQWEEPDPHAGIESHVSVEFTPVGNQTKLKITHTNLNGIDMASRHELGWLGTFDRLFVWLELEVK